MSDGKSYLKDKVFLIICGILTLIRIIIAMGIPLKAIGDSPVDDVLLLEYAKSIAEGNWLGEYGPYTNVKGMTYSVVVAIFYKLNIPYSLGIILLYIFACLLTVKALSPKIKNKYVQGILYIVLLYSPVMLTTNYTQRIYRMAIVPTFVLFVFACHIGLYLRVSGDTRNIWKWAVGDAISVALFWYIREDSIWILPFLIVSTFFMIIKIKKDTWNVKIKKIGLTLSPFLGICIISLMIMSVNYHQYGVASLTDLCTYMPSEYNEFMNNLVAIKPDEEVERVEVNRDAIKKACDASETLNTISDEINFFYDENWKSYGNRNIENEIEGFYYWWAFRQILGNAGYYVDAVETQEFIKAINDELAIAFANGVLEKKDSNNSIINNMLNDSKPFLEKFVESGVQMLTYSKCGVNSAYGTGNEDTVRFIEIITNERIMYADRTEISGWIFAKNSDDKLKMIIVDESDSVLQEVIFTESMDVFSEFQIENAKFARFNTNELFKKYEVVNLNANIYLNDELYKTINLNQPQKDYDDELIAYNIESVVATDIMSNQGAEYILLGNIIVKIYQVTSWIVCGLVACSYIYICWKSISKKDVLTSEWREDWLISTACGLSAVVLLFVVCYTYRIAWNANSRDLYLAGVIPLLDLFKYYTIIRVGNNIYYNFRERKLNETYNTNTML